MGGALSEAVSTALSSATGVGVCTIQLKVQVDIMHHDKHTTFKHNHLQCNHGLMLPALSMSRVLELKLLQGLIASEGLPMRVVLLFPYSMRINHCWNIPDFGDVEENQCGTLRACCITLDEGR